MALQKINRITCLNNYPIFPLRWYDELKEEIECSYPKTYQSYVLTVPAKSWKGHMKLLGTAWQQLSSLLGHEALIYLGDTTTPWRGQENDYAPVKEADLYLATQRVGKRFNGGLRVSMEALPEFIKHLAWLSRCNASLPYFHATDNRQQILASICQYGNVHIELLDPKVNGSLKKAIAGTAFQVVRDARCSNLYSTTGSIKGRKIIL